MLRGNGARAWCHRQLRLVIDLEHSAWQVLRVDDARLAGDIFAELEVLSQACRAAGLVLIGAGDFVDCRQCRGFSLSRLTHLFLDTFEAAWHLVALLALALRRERSIACGRVKSDERLVGWALIISKFLLAVEVLKFEDVPRVPDFLIRAPV